MTKLTILGLLVSTAIYAAPAPPPPPPPSAVIFAGSHTFRDSTDLWQAPVNVPGDGAWLTLIGTTAGSYMDCYHRYAADLTPNFSLYTSPLFQLGTGQGRDEACLNNICFSCYTHWGGQPTYTYHTTTTNPGFLPAGSGVIGVRSLTGGGTGDSLYLNVAQINRDAMQSMSMFLARDEDDPTPMQQAEIDAAYFIADSEDRVPVVLEFQYGTDWFPAGPGLTYTATWDKTTTLVPEYNPGPLMPLGYSILGIPIPKLSTGKHAFTVTAKLPGGKTFTTAPMSVWIYERAVYITVDGPFKSSQPEDQSAQFVAGEHLDGTEIDLLKNAQELTVNVLLNRRASGDFSIDLADVTHYPGIAMNAPPGSSGDTDPDMYFDGMQTTLTGIKIPKGGKGPKWVTLKLFVRDYAASGTIEATLPYGKHAKYTERHFIPSDPSSGGLPPLGWNVFNDSTGLNVHVSTTGLFADDDEDTGPVVSLGDPMLGRFGDGLTALEEYRGLYVQGVHHRLDPREKDAFIRMNTDILADSELVPKLLFRLWFLAPTEAEGELNPVINPNDLGVGNAQTQRAVRVRYQYLPPLVTLNGQTITALRANLQGWTFLNGEPLSNVDLDALTNAESPDTTAVAEVYPAVIGSKAISAGPNGTLETSVAATDSLFVDTKGAQGIIPGADKTFESVLCNLKAGCDDIWTDLFLTACSSSESQYLNAADLTLLRKMDVAHETGHGFDIDHNHDCDSIMVEWMTWFPIPGSFTINDLGQVRLHRKHF